MEFERYLQPIEVIGFFLENGGRVTNVELINHFKPFLSKTLIGQENLAYLKRLTGKLVIVKKLNRSKYLELKPQFQDTSPYEIFANLQNEFGALEIANVPQPETKLMVVPNTDTLTRARSREPVYDPISLEKESDYFVMPKDRQEAPAIKVQEREDVKQDLEYSQVLEKSRHVQEFSVQHPIQPELPVKVESEVPDGDTDAEEDERDDEVFPLPSGSKLEDKERTLSRNRVSVKDLSKSFEAKIEEQAVVETPHHKAYKKEKIKLSRKQSSDVDNKDSYPYTQMDENKRKWIVAASKTDELTLARLMRADPEIFRTRDPTSGYTALHWAARRGNDGLIHVLLGVHRMEVNLRTRSNFLQNLVSTFSEKGNIKK